MGASAVAKSIWLLVWRFPEPSQLFKSIEIIREPNTREQMRVQFLSKNMTVSDLVCV